MADQDLDVALYDLYVGDWPHEIAFYRAAASRAQARGEVVLEVACGTGRVAIRLAAKSVQVVGLDRSLAMLDVARSKSSGMSNIAWVQADMRDVKLDARFGLALIPGHDLLDDSEEMIWLLKNGL